MQCRGINKNGERCCRKTHDKLCWQHKPKNIKPKSPKIVVIIYTIPTCSYCIKAKLLLDKKSIPYKEIIVNDPIKRQLIKKTGQKTVPQIFINDKFIGGYTDLVNYLRQK